MTIEILRSVERILGVLIAGLSIYLGFRLFLALPKKTDGTGKLVLPGGINVFLSRVGPGVFFALFGCALVIMSFKQAVTFERGGSKPSGQGSAGSPVPVDYSRYHGIADFSNLSKEEQSQRLADTRRALMDINRLGYPLLTHLKADERLVLERALERSQLALVASVWKTNWGSFDTFEAWVNSDQTSPLPVHTAEAQELLTSNRPTSTP